MQSMDATTASAIPETIIVSQGSPKSASRVTFSARESGPGMAPTIQAAGTGPGITAMRT